MTLGPARFDGGELHLRAQAAQEIGHVFAHGLLADLLRARIALRIDAGNRHQVLEQFDNVRGPRHALSLGGRSEPGQDSAAGSLRRAPLQSPEN